MDDPENPRVKEDEAGSIDPVEWLGNRILDASRHEQEKTYPIPEALLKHKDDMARRLTNAGVKFKFAKGPTGVQTLVIEADKKGR